MIDLQCGGAGGRHLIGIYVIYCSAIISGNAGNYGNMTLTGEQAEERGVDLMDAADRAQFRRQLSGGSQMRIDSGETDGAGAGGAQSGDDRGIHAAAEHFGDSPDGLITGDAKAVEEAAFNAAALQSTGQLPAAAMDDEEGVAGGLGGCDLARQVCQKQRVFRQGTADFDEGFQKSPSVSGNPSARFILWTACPAAPLPRLSMAATINPRPEISSNSKPISQ